MQLLGLRSEPVSYFLAFFPTHPHLAMLYLTIQPCFSS